MRATLSGQTVTRATVQIPAWGLPWAEVETDSSEALEDSTVELQIADLTLAGTVITSGTVQVYAYDAYGLPLGFDLAAALTTHLYSGEQTDQLTGLQYLRAKYYNPATGTFNRLDPFAGNFSEPQSLHKYLYTHADPVNGVDPTGNMTLKGLTAAFNTRMVLSGQNARAALSVLRQFGGTQARASAWNAIKVQAQVAERSGIRGSGVDS